MMPSLNAISLFSSSGIGDLGLAANNIKTIIACELLSERAQLFTHNFPDTKMFQGDIWQLSDDIITYYKNNFKQAPFLIIATPPCQGMSSNGMGTILRNFRNGTRPKLDERNRLIIPTLKIIKELLPEWVIFENVPNMQNTLIMDENDHLVNIIDFIKLQLGEIYIGEPTIVDAANYGIPQHRKRLISIFTRTQKGQQYFKTHHSFLPDITNSDTQQLFTKKFLTLKDVIGDLPILEATAGKNTCNELPLHRVPILDDIKLSWIRHTPEGQTALNNQCINPNCLFQNNPTHGCQRDESGINRSKDNTPIYCIKCGAILPRPYTKDKKTGEIRVMKAFTSAYKRMKWNEPASTLTQNFQYACSDNKLHPTQNRVLSLWEGLIIQTIANYNYSFCINGKYVADSIIRDTIGESVPPKLIDQICAKIKNIELN
ncbi:MAG: DNA cytosine methyltransferase [Paludibacteraceae bacterium]